MSSSSSGNNSNATTTRDLQDTYVTQLAHLFALKDEQYNLDNTRAGMSHEIERLKTEIEWNQDNLAKEESMGSSTRKNSSQKRMKHAIEVAEKKLIASLAALQEHEQIAETHRLTVNTEETALQALLDTFFPCPVRFQDAGNEQQQQQQQATPGVSAFWRMMEDVDAAAHMLEYMSMKNVLTGVGAVSRAYKAQTEAVFSTIVLRYQTNSTIPPLTKFPRLRHLRIDAIDGAHCLAGLVTVAARLESLVLEIDTPAATKAFAAIASFPKLRHLHLGKSGFPRSAQLNIVGKYPVLESLTVDEMCPFFYLELLGSQSNSRQALPKLCSLTFPDNHVLLGGSPQYLQLWTGGTYHFYQPLNTRVSISDILSRYPETAGLEVDRGQSHHLKTFRPSPGLKRLRLKGKLLSDAFLNNLAQHAGSTLTEMHFYDSRLDILLGHHWNQPPPVLNIAPGAFETLRALALSNVSFTMNQLTTLLQGVGDHLEVLNLDLLAGTSQHKILQLLGGTLAAPWLASLRCLTISIGEWPNISINQQCDQLFAALTRLQALESLQLMLMPPGLMDIFIVRFTFWKEKGRFACLRELKLMKRFIRRTSAGVREASTCSMPTALLLRVWVEMNKQNLTRGLHIPLYPLPYDSTLLHTLNAILGKSVEDGYVKEEKK